MEISSNGYHCPRCIKGFLLVEFGDKVCLNCGWRQSIARDQEDVKSYLSECIVNRLIHNDNGDMNDIKIKHLKKAGMTH